jgi:lipoprotein-anchoring transpeptidase ErfK/SrfK
MVNKSLKVAALALGGLVAVMLAGAPRASAEDFLDELLSGFSSGGRHEVEFEGNYPRGTIIVSFGDRRLYFINGRNSAISYPIAIPKSEARWSGVTTISHKTVNPTWTPTAQMRQENPTLPVSVPGGHPRNPLGVRALYLGSTTYRIHGTDAPWLIGHEVSHGCIRMHNEDVIDLYPRAQVGAKVIVTWKRFDDA